MKQKRNLKFRNVKGVKFKNNVDAPNSCPMKVRAKTLQHFDIKPICQCTPLFSFAAFMNC